MDLVMSFVRMIVLAAGVYAFMLVYVHNNIRHSEQHIPYNHEAKNTLQAYSMEHHQPDSAMHEALQQQSPLNMNDTIQEQSISDNSAAQISDQLNPKNTLNQKQTTNQTDHINGVDGPQKPNERSMNPSEDRLHSRTPVCPASVRLSHLRAACGSVTPRDPGSLSRHQLLMWTRHLVVDDAHRLLYCIVAKAGSSTWLNLLANNSAGSSTYTPREAGNIHDPETLAAHNLTYLWHHRPDAIVKRLTEYRKLLVVRHPLDRLASAYMDKIAKRGTPYWNAPYLEKVIKRFGQNPNFRPPERGENATFGVFLDYYLRYGTRDQHFRSVVPLCRPCLIRYDHIAKLETQDSDAHHVIHRYLSGKGDASFTAHNDRGGARLGKPLALYRGVTAGQLAAVSAALTADMTLFGYSVGENLTTACSIDDGQGGVCC